MFYQSAFLCYLNLYALGIYASIKILLKFRLYLSNGILNSTSLASYNKSAPLIRDNNNILFNNVDIAKSV